MHTFAGIYAHIYVNSLTPGARAVLPNMVYYAPGEAFLPHLSKERSVSGMMYVIMWTGDSLLLWHPGTWVTTANMASLNPQLREAGDASFYVRKHLPPVSTWNSGMAWDSSFTMATALQSRDQLSLSPTSTPHCPAAPAAECKSLQHH